MAVGKSVGMWAEPRVRRHYCPNCGAKMDGGDNDAKSM